MLLLLTKILAQHKGANDEKGMACWLHNNCGSFSCTVISKLLVCWHL
jgi:hypothetical protein